MAPKKKRKPSKVKEQSGHNTTQPQLPATRQAASSGFRGGFLNQNDKRNTNKKKSSGDMSGSKSIKLDNVNQYSGSDSDSVPSLRSDSSDYDTDSNSGTNSESDFIKITTLPIFKYVSRACGFKSIYTESKISIIEDSSNWIFNYEIINDHIEYENKAHIKIYH